MVKHSDPNSFFCMWLLSFSNIIYWRNCPFPIVYSWLFCCKLIDNLCVDLFMGFLIYSVDLYVCSYANTMLLWYLQFSQDCFGFLGSFVVPCIFLGLFVLFLWKVPMHFGRHCIKYLDFLGILAILMSTKYLSIYLYLLKFLSVMSYSFSVQVFHLLG